MVSGLAWMRDVRDHSDVSGAAVAVAWAIGLRSDRHGHCYPSYDRLAADCHVARSTVQRGVSELVAAGWLLRIQRVSKKTRRQQSNVYQLLVPVLDSKFDEPVDNPPPDTDSEYRTIPTVGTHVGTDSRYLSRPNRSTHESDETEGGDNAPKPMANVVAMIARGMRLP